MFEICNKNKTISNSKQSYYMFPEAKCIVLL